MNDIIIRDLLKNNGRELGLLLNEFNRNAAWCGYFFDGPDAEKLAVTAKYENIPRHGLHITVWDKNNGELNAQNFIKTVMDIESHDFKVLGYADDNKNQAILVERPSLFLSPATAHMSISWRPDCNAAASGYMQFGPVPSYMNIPSVMHDGQMRFIMHNNREMTLDGFREAIRRLEINRMQELEPKLPEQVKHIIQHTDLYKINWDELKKLLISNGFEFNEKFAALYAQYLIDTTDSKMLTRSQIEAQEEEEEAMYDKMTDKQHDEDEEQARSDMFDD